MSFYGYASFPFQLHIVQELIQHLPLADSAGDLKYPVSQSGFTVVYMGYNGKVSNFIHKNTDGPLNPYSKVYDLQTVIKDFPNFKFIRFYKQHMHSPPLPVHWLPLESVLGWHLWIHMRPDYEQHP